MAEERESGGRRTAQPAERETAETASEGGAQALADMVKAASALQLIQAQAAVEAMKVPEKRLDDASEQGGASGTTLKQIGPDEFIEVDADGNEVKKGGRRQEP